MTETGLLSQKALVYRPDRGNEAGPTFLPPGSSQAAPPLPPSRSQPAQWFCSQSLPVHSARPLMICGVSNSSQSCLVCSNGLGFSVFCSRTLPDIVSLFVGLCLLLNCETIWFSTNISKRFPEEHFWNDSDCGHHR